MVTIRREFKKKKMEILLKTNSELVLYWKYAVFNLDVFVTRLLCPVIIRLKIISE